jgi:hypothetical protein
MLSVTRHACLCARLRIRALSSVALVCNERAVLELRWSAVAKRLA